MKVQLPMLINTVLLVLFSIVLFGCASKSSRTTRTCYAHTGSGANQGTYSYRVPCGE